MGYRNLFYKIPLMFALVDCNNFYASCERVFRPDLRNKPVVVLSNNDGCVIARSSEAKQLGIPMGAPAYKYDDMFKANEIEVFSSNYALYGDMSARIVELLMAFTPHIEIYSIDECFLKFDMFKKCNFNLLGATIKSHVERCTGIPISIGFAPTKGLSKIANKMAKQIQYGSTGVYTIDSHDSRVISLKSTAIEDVWGIGKQNQLKLKAKGVHDAHAFSMMKNDWVRTNMSVTGLRLKLDLEGAPTLGLEDIIDKKSIATTRSFKTNLTAYAELKERITTFASLCAEKLRRQKSKTTLIEVFLNTNKHRKDLNQYKRSIDLCLPYPTNSSIEIAQFAVQALRRIYIAGYEYKKAGVLVKDVRCESSCQTALFAESNPRHKVLMKTVDDLNEKMGMHKVRLGSQDHGSVWKMRRDRLSPKYTTQLSDILSVKA